MGERVVVGRATPVEPIDPSVQERERKRVVRAGHFGIRDDQGNVRLHRSKLISKAIQPHARAFGRGDKDGCRLKEFDALGSFRPIDVDDGKDALA